MSTYFSQPGTEHLVLIQMNSLGIERDAVLRVGKRFVVGLDHLWKQRTGRRTAWESFLVGDVSQCFHDWLDSDFGVLVQFPSHSWVVEGS